MTVPVFDLPVLGAAPNQYATENGLESEINRVLQKLYDVLSANAGKIFPSRQAPIDMGQAKLPATYGVIITLEGPDVVFRLPGDASSPPEQDPLFPGSYPSWRVGLRISVRQLIRDIGIITLDPVETGVDGNAIIAKFPASIVTNGVNSPSPNMLIAFMAAGFSTTGEATLSLVDNDGEVIDEAPLLQESGAPLTAEINLQQARFYTFRRFGSSWRMAWGDIRFSDLLNAIAQEVIDRDAAIATAVTEINAAWQEADAGLQAQVAEITGRAYPGNKVIAISEDSDGKPTTGVASDTGRFWSPQGMDMSDGNAIRYPGNQLDVFVESENGVPIAAVDLERNRFWGLGLDAKASIYPGDHLIVLAEDAAGTPVLAWRTDTNTLWWAGENGSTGGGSAVEFTDPVTGVQSYMAIRSGEVIRYMDGAKWPGHLIGFEERMIDQLPLAIAQTPDPALGIVAFGGGTGYVQTPGNDYPWHILGTDLIAAGDGFEAQRAANEFQTTQDAVNKSLYSIFALSEVFGSGVEADGLSGSAHRQAILAQVVAARESAAAFGKRLYIDRIHLSLLEGQPSISQPAADLHYAGVAQDMALELATAAEQAAMPIIVVTQGFGTRDNGLSNVALAEGRLHWTHWSLGIICATPRYPFPLVDGMPGLHTPQAALQIAELQNLAAMAKLSGGSWYPPSLEQATISGNVITARFSSLDDTIVLRDPVAHGFTVDGDSAGAVITDVSVAGVLATITLDVAAVDGGTGLFLNYAYGESGDPGDGYPANRGSITDSWSRESRHGGTLYRYALSNRVAITVE